MFSFRIRRIAMKSNSLKITLIAVVAVALYIIWPSLLPVGNENAAVADIAIPQNDLSDNETEIPFAAETIALPEETVRYLQNSLLYGNYYNENQKFVVYFTDISYPSSFLPALNNLSQNTPYREEYAFIPRGKNTTGLAAAETSADQTFVGLCRQFCVINPQRNEIFYIDGIGTEDAREIGNIFDGLEDW